MRREAYSYSCVMARLPEPLASMIREIAEEIPDSLVHDDGSNEQGREDEPHVTVKYGLHTEDPEEVAAVVIDSAVAARAAVRNPFSFTRAISAPVPCKSKRPSISTFPLVSFCRVRRSSALKGGTTGDDRFSGAAFGLAAFLAFALEFFFVFAGSGSGAQLFRSSATSSENLVFLIG